MDVARSLCQWPTGCPDRAETRGHCTPHYKQLWWLNRMPSTFIQADPARERIGEHLTSGRTYHSLAALCGVDDKALRHIHQGRTTQVRASTADRVFVVPLRATDVGCQRRVNALQRVGHSHRVIAAAVGCSVSRVKTIATELGRVRDPVADGLTATYPGLSVRWGESRVARVAAERGRLGPWAWTLDTIDDPAAVPGPSPGPQHSGGMSGAYVTARTGLQVPA